MIVKPNLCETAAFLRRLGRTYHAAYHVGGKHLQHACGCTRSLDLHRPGTKEARSWKVCSLPIRLDNGITCPQVVTKRCCLAVDCIIYRDSEQLQICNSGVTTAEYFRDMGYNVPEINQVTMILPCLGADRVLHDASIRLHF